MSTLTSADRALHEFAALVGADDPIAVEGNRTRWHLGGPLDESARLVTAPTGIVDYQPSEMVVTVRAGTTVAELHETLAAAGQTSALPDRGGTVGGAVAVGENRLDRLGRGSARDAVLQVRYVSAEGEIVTGGGPVVKNVSGFNLPKLIVGSLGTLGLIAEVVLRTNPLPPVQRWIRAERVAPRDIRDALLRPGAVLWDGTSSWALVEGHEVDVDAEVAREAHVAHNVLDRVHVVADEAEDAQVLEHAHDAAHGADGHLAADGARDDELARGEEERGGLWAVDADRDGGELAAVVDGVG